MFVIPSYLNLCFLKCFLCCFWYILLYKSKMFLMLPLLFLVILLYKSMIFLMFPLLFVGIWPYLNLRFSNDSYCYFWSTFLSKAMCSDVFFVVFVIASYLNICLFPCFLSCFCYTFLSKSMHVPLFLCCFFTYPPI